MIRARRVIAPLLAVLGAMALLAGCSSSPGGEAFPRVVTLGEGEVFPAILNSSLTVGDNRLVMTLTDDSDEPILGARVRLRFFDLNNGDTVAAGEADAGWVPVTYAYIDEQSGRVREETGEGGAYIASVSFSRAGDWGVKVAVTAPDGHALEEAPFRFTVRDRSAEPMVGDDAPRSRQQVLAQAADIAEIDSSYPPRPHMHDLTIADALAAGRPAVIAFATPAYCASRLCAPVMDTVMDPLQSAYSDAAAFIHVEPYVLRDMREGFVQNAAPAAREWNIQSEPWIFVVGPDGRVAAKFEGVIARDEVEAALQRTLAAP